MDRCIDGGRSLIDVELHIVQPSLYDIGDEWQANRVTVAKEHMATAIALSVMTIGLLRSPPPATIGKRALLACVEGNDHTVGLRMVADAFQLAGWDVQYLGANMPTSAIIRQAADWQADLVGLSVSFAQQLRVVKDVIRQLRERLGEARPAVIIGGLAINRFNRLAEMVGADACGADAQAAVAYANRTRRQIAFQVPWFAPELEPLLAVAVAALDKDGTLIEANAGFLKLIDLDGPQPIGARVGRFFIQPDFATLARAHDGADGEIHQGLLTVGDYLGRSRSLRTRIWRVNGQLRVLAEYDIEELEQLYDIVLELNRDYAGAQFELTQTNLKLQQREAQILAASLTDPLTGVGNRRRLEQALALEISRAERMAGKLCALMADLDHFKRVNDTYGHEAGDKVLAAFSDLLRRCTRATDVVARFGGEEFVVLMPATDLAQASAIAERIRGEFAACRVAPLPDPVTSSFGVAELKAGEQGHALLRRADSALYTAKQLGRNRVAGG